MATKTTRHELSDFSAVLHVAIDLGSTTWKLVSGVPGKRARCQTIKAGDLPAFQEELLRAKVRFDLSAEADVVSCYEAGRDGFWLHRYLERAGVRSLVIDPASCEVDRRAKQPSGSGS